MRESAIEQALVKHVKKHGGMAYKWVSPGNKGVPDRIVLLQGATFFVETKAPDGRLSPLQKVQHKKLASLGFDVVVINNKQQAKLWVELQVSNLKILMLTPEERIKVLFT